MKKNTRRFLGIAIGVAVGASLLVSHTSPANAVDECFTYADFSNTTGMAVRGSARINSANALVLNPRERGTFGSGYRTSRSLVKNGFNSQFRFQLTPNAGEDGSDGFAFVIHNSSQPIADSFEGGMGYHGLPNSIAIEFDTWNGDFNFDTDSNHISIHSEGTAANSSDERRSLGRVTTVPKLNDGKVHSVTIHYVPGRLTIAFDGVDVLSVPNLDLNNLLSLDNGAAFLGLSGTTSSDAYQLQTIRSWHHCSSTTPPSTTSTTAPTTSSTVPSTTSTTTPPPGPDCNNPTIRGTEGADTITGTTGDDVILALGGNDQINSGDGDDLICAGDGDDVVNGGDDFDRIFGGLGNDTLNGQPGNDNLEGEAGRDKLSGGSGKDLLVGGNDGDRVDGGTGTDFVEGGAGDDTLIGGSEVDTCNGDIGSDTATTCENTTNVP